MAIWPVVKSAVASGAIFEHLESARLVLKELPNCLACVDVLAAACLALSSQEKATGPGVAAAFYAV